MYAYIDSFRKFGKTNTDNQSIKIKRPYPSEGRGSFFSLRPAAFLHPPVAGFPAEPLGSVRYPFLPQSTQFSPPRSVGSCPSAPEPTGVSPPDFRYADCRGFLESVCDAIFLAYDRFFIYFCAPDSGRVRMRSFSAPNGKMKDLKISCLMKKLFVAALALAAMTACCGGAADATLEGTTWKLSKMEGIPATAIDGESDAFTLVFNAADTMVAGRTNCNRFFGKYEAGEGKLELGPLGMTRMACPDMEFENAFVQMLDEVDRYEISGTTLKFYDDQTLLAEFLAVTLEPAGEPAAVSEPAAVEPAACAEPAGECTDCSSCEAAAATEEPVAAEE